MPGLFDGAFGRGGLLPYGADPFAAAALRMRQAARPEGGRPEGLSSYVLTNYVPHVVQALVSLPQRAFGAADEAWRTARYDPGPVLETATMMVGAPGVPRGTLGSAMRRLPMDEASRIARARQLGYADEPFFRGEATGRKPTEFLGGAYFSRDFDTAAGFAKRGGATAPAEYRLNLTKTFNLGQPVPAESYGRLVAELRKADPTLASSMVDAIAPGRDIDWFMEFAKRNPNVPVADNGALVHQIVDRGSRDPIGTFVRAGFDAIDAGRDVRKLTGSGIRSKDAAFDPQKWNDPNMMASLFGLGVPLPVAMGNPNQE